MGAQILIVVETKNMPSFMSCNAAICSRTAIGELDQITEHSYNFVTDRGLKCPRIEKDLKGKKPKGRGD